VAVCSHVGGLYSHIARLIPKTRELKDSILPAVSGRTVSIARLIPKTRELKVYHAPPKPTRCPRIARLIPKTRELKVPLSKRICEREQARIARLIPKTRELKVNTIKRRRLCSPTIARLIPKTRELKVIFRPLLIKIKQHSKVNPENKGTERLPTHWLGLLA